MPPTPPLPSDTEIPSTPPTSPQRHQQAARNQERNQRDIGSPEQRRTPVIPPHPPVPSSLMVQGNELTHVSLNMCTHMIGIAPHPTLQRRGHAPPQVFPLPPPPTLIAAAAASGSMAPALGPPFHLPLPPPPSASSSRQTLDSAQLRAAYVPLPVQTRSRGRPSVSCILLFLLPFNQLY